MISLIKKPFVDGKGRLRSSVLAFFILCLILLGASLLYKAREPGKKVMVKVKHVFLPKEKQSSAQEEVKKEPKPAQLAAAHETKSQDHQQKPDQAPKPEQDSPRTPVETGSPERQAGEYKVPEPPKEKMDADAKKTPEPIEPPKDAVKKKPEPARPIARKQETLPTEVLKVDKHSRAITVDKSLYRKIYQGWKDSGKKGKTEKMDLSVENLPAVYRLFQMKPIAVGRSTSGRDKYVDLNDGLLTSSESLEEYSGTVFEASEPWNDWGRELKAAGFTKDQPVVVRYYMYPFVRNSIYQRANRAYEFCMANNLLPSTTKLSDVDVHGKTFVIKRDGGGKIGVFVPVQIKTAGGRSVKIDPRCFEDEIDVKILMESGML